MVAAADAEVLDLGLDLAARLLEPEAAQVAASVGVEQHEPAPLHAVVARNSLETVVPRSQHGGVHTAGVLAHALSLLVWVPERVVKGKVL